VNDRQNPVSLKLVDFGLGSMLGEQHAHGTVGTPGFAAPEVYGRGSYTEVADIFSAGVVLYILLTGRPPFKAPTDMLNIRGHIQSLFDGPDLESEPFSKISELTRALLDRMLLPNPAFRCTAAKALDHACFKEGTLQSSEPVLWHSTNSEVHFLQVMGVWEGASRGGSQSGTGVPTKLEKISESDDEDEEQSHILEALCISIVHQLPIAVCVADPGEEDCPIVAVSRGFTETTGFTNSQCIGRNCRFLNVTRATEMAKESRDGLQRAVREETTFLGVVPNAKADGTPFNNLLHLSPLDLGSKTYMVGVQMETKDPEPFPHGQNREEALAVVRKAHGLIRHWVRASQCGVGACKLRTDTDAAS